MKITRQFQELENGNVLIPISDLQGDGDFMENVEDYLRENGVVAETQDILSMQVRFDRVDAKVSVVEVEVQSNVINEPRKPQ